MDTKGCQSLASAFNDLQLQNETDPMELSSFTCDFVLQHLSGVELLELSLVSEQWYQKIGQASAFKTKIVVRIDPSHPFFPKPRIDIVSCIKNSKRKYEMLFIRDREFKNELEFLPNHQWKHVEFFGQDLTGRQYMDVLKIIAPTVEHLTISLVKVQGRTHGIEFQNLKVLVLKNLDKAIDHFVDEDLKLDELVYESRNRDDCEKLKMILTNNPSLKKLAIKCQNIDWMKQPTDFKFDLDSFLFIAIFQLEEVCLKKLKSFINSQGQTLKKLKLVNIFDIGLIFQIWNSMKSLEEIVLTYILFGNEVYLNKIPQTAFPQQFNSNLNINNNLKTFIPNCRRVPSSFWRPVLRASPNLTALSIEGLYDELNDGLMTQVSKLPHLRKLICHKSSPTIQEFAENIRKRGKNKSIVLLEYHTIDLCQDSITRWWFDDDEKKRQKLRSMVPPERYEAAENSMIVRRLLQVTPKNKPPLATKPKVVTRLLDWNPIDTLHRDIYENILKFLSVNEMLTASLVSKNWNDSIGSSTEFRKRATVFVMENDNIDQTSMQFSSSRPRKDPTCLVKSRRNLVNLKMIKHTFDATNHHFWIEKFDWKKVTAELIFPTVDGYIQFLKSLGAGVEKLDLKVGPLCHQYSFETDKIKFPALKDLRINAFNPLILEPFVTAHDRLKHFSILIDVSVHMPMVSFDACRSICDLNTDKILKFLEKNSTIESLGLHGASISVLKKKSLLQLPLKLRMLSLRFGKNRSGNGAKFVKQQGDHLEALIIKSYDNSLAHQVWNSMKNLRFLSLACYSFSIEFIQENEPRNLEKLTYLSLHSALELPFVVFEAIATASPNLEALFIPKLAKEIVAFAACNLLKLKTISYEQFDTGAELKKEMERITKDVQFKHETFKSFERSELKKNLNFPKLD